MSTVLGLLVGFGLAGVFLAGVAYGKSWGREEAESDRFWRDRGEPTMAEWKKPRA